MNISNKIIEKNHKLVLLNYDIEPELNNYRSWVGKNYEDEINDFMKIIKENKFDTIIIDHYGIDYLLEKKIKKYCDKLIVISDIFEFNHYCDIFINYNCDNIKEVKKINLNERTEYKIGVENIILNKKFIDSPKKTVFKNELKNIVINMGGSDPHNYILKIIQKINDYIIEKNINVIIIIGKSNTHVNLIKEFINNIKNYNIYIDINYDEMINLYLNSDLVIGSLSITAYERLILNIPQISLKIVENQLIQELDKFNIINIDYMLNKILKYNKIIQCYL
jgi:spore coat polysaccharide biosynthesis predicted glycosyltransferase SpsG